MEERIKQIFDAVSEYHEIPVRLGGRCESNTYYRVADLSVEDVEVCAEYIAERIIKVCSPNLPELILNMPGSFSGLADALAKQLAPIGESIPVLNVSDLSKKKDLEDEIKGKPVVLVNDVITTARSCLEAHTKITMLGAQISCWACMIDRTFGPGPVPVIAAHTGEPVQLLEHAAL